ncbi:hypothetical protein [Caldimonas thermodepolymerans]|uniref:hypothetical protein n=1 Tax=Caldimonas thermodepolymerans TaxID=215580 RepID=UPI0022368E71|nr:hypothetical protein [Caldimonas thermodepolymerans]UZG45435.1 hypothetical protein ONZ46_05640 [Caldimonas thermodepolymerans]
MHTTWRHAAIGWVWAGAALAQPVSSPVTGRPPPEVGPAPVVQPDAVRHAEGSEGARPRSDPFMDFNDPRLRDEMSRCTAQAREARGDCVRGLGAGPPADARESAPAAPRDPGRPLRDRDPGLRLPR